MLLSLRKSPPGLINHVLTVLVHPSKKGTHSTCFFAAQGVTESGGSLNGLGLFTELPFLHKPLPNPPFCASSHPLPKSRLKRNRGKNSKCYCRLGKHGLDSLFKEVTLQSPWPLTGVIQAIRARNPKKSRKGPGAERLKNRKNPVLLFLDVFVSLVFFLLGISLVFLSVFSVFSKVFRGSQGEKNP